ncbi:uncharacterized protein [Dendrobates tinctorius]|uniref:uncharacterized protein n=1 Tax=Dendrobates tinctorius TaxID=92724 RepID=UPI003CC9CFDA
MDLRLDNFRFKLDLDIALSQAYAFCCQQERERERRQRRRFWRHPIIELRPSRGAYHTLYSELQENPEKFAGYTRMSQESFLDLLGMGEGNIRKRDTQLRRAIPPEERLLVTLRFLATGESLSSLHLQYRLGISTLSGIVADTCRALWDVLCPEFLPLPTAEKWLQISDKFWAVCNFPNCLGAEDGKHIRITKPARSGSEYYNYKKYFSTVLMAIADADCRFMAVDIGAFRWGNDSQTFKNSDMGWRLYGNHFNFSLARPLRSCPNEGPICGLLFIRCGSCSMAGSNGLIVLLFGKNKIHVFFIPVPSVLCLNTLHYSPAQVKGKKGKPP